MSALFTCPYCQQGFAAGPTLTEQMQHKRWDPRHMRPHCPHCDNDLSWKWHPSPHPAYDRWMQACAGALLALATGLWQSADGQPQAAVLASWPVYLWVMALLGLVTLPYLAMVAGWLWPARFTELGYFSQRDPNVTRESGLWIWPLALSLMAWCMMLHSEPPRFMALLFIVAAWLSPADKSLAGAISFAAVAAVLWLCPAFMLVWVAGALLVATSAASLVSVAWFVQLYRPRRTAAE